MNQQSGQSPSHQMTKAINRILDSGSIAVLITVMAGMPEVGAKLLVEVGGPKVGSLGNTELDSLSLSHALTFLNSRENTRAVSVKELAPEFPSSESILLLFERLEPARRLIVCGAGHVGAALARLGSFVGYHTTLIDDRAEFLTRDRFAEEQIDLVVAENWTDSVRNAVGTGKGVAIAVVTRGHNQDEECMHAIGGAALDYVGLIGSKRRTNIVIDKLRRSGVAEANLRNIHAPIGLDIGAVTPEEVALAIIAEIVANNRGRKGQSLSDWRRLK